MLTNWKSKLTAIQNGTLLRANVAFVGDSTTVGYGSVPTINQEKLYSYPFDLTNYFLYEKGVNACQNNCFGGSNDTPYPATNYPLQTVDDRVTGGGWLPAGNFSLGGSMLWASSTSELIFSPIGPFDTVDVWYVDGMGGTATVNGTPIVANGPVATIKKATIPVSGSTVSFNWESGNFLLIGWDVYPSTIPTVHLWNMGCGGSKSTDWSANAHGYDPLPALQYLAPDLTIINLGINDRDLPNPIDTYQTCMQSIIAAAKASGDVLLLTPMASSSATCPLATQAAYNNVLHALAASNSIDLLDIASIWPWLLANSLGRMFDGAHGNQYGYAAVADQIYAVIGNP
jgi:lysophospholipase L1-like esterase